MAQKLDVNGAIARLIEIPKELVSLVEKDTEGITEELDKYRTEISILVREFSSGRVKEAGNNALKKVRELYEKLPKQ